MEICSMLCSSLDERKVWGMDTCICMAESLWCSPETITNHLLIGSTPIQNKKLKKTKQNKTKQLSFNHLNFCWPEPQVWGHKGDPNSEGDPERQASTIKHTLLPRTLFLPEKFLRARGWTGWWPLGDPSGTPALSNLCRPPRKFSPASSPEPSCHTQPSPS